jgi:hypothetical protein
MKAAVEKWDGEHCRNHGMEYRALICDLSEGIHSLANRQA